MSVARIIADQIGGKALFLIGAKNLVGSENSLTFKVGRNARGVTHIKITLDEGLDLYNCEALKVRGAKVAKVKESNGIYCDGLHDFIADATGLDTNF